MLAPTPTPEPTEAPVYAITFDTLGGSDVAQITGAEGEAIVAPDDPTREGYLFQGWDPELPTSMPGNDMTITAQWLPMIIAVEPLKQIDITYKPTLEDALALMPGAVQVTLADATTVAAKLEWGAESCPKYSAGKGDGSYVFTALSLTTEAGNPLAGDLSLPSCALVVAPAISGDCTYRLDEAGDLTIIAWNARQDELLIPGEIDGHPVKYIADGVFQDNVTLTRLELPAGIRTIGKKAVAGCTALETLVLPDSLESVGKDLIKGDSALVNLILRTDLESRLTAVDTVEHTVKVDQEETEYSLTLSRAFTDIIVNSSVFTLECSFTVATGHSVSVEANGTLKLAADNTLTNLSTVYNEGVVKNSGTIVTCGGTWRGNPAEKGKSGAYVTDHAYASGVCSVCGQKEDIVVTTLDISYVGAKLTKVYDKTRNVSLKGSDFKISGVLDNHSAVRLTGIRAAFDNSAVGDRTVSVSFTIGGDDAACYLTKDITIPATITAKPLIITPTEDQKKNYGAADPSYFTGKVRGLLSGDTITGKLARESGEKVGKYKILQGTIDAGSNYAVEVVEEYFAIVPKSINSTDVGLMTIGNQRYTGSEVKPTITLRYGVTELKQDVDFEAKFSNNIQPGTAKVVLTGKGNYTGERTASFNILNITTDTSGSGSGGSYTHGGFSGGGFSDMDDDDDFFDDDDDFDDDYEDDGDEDEYDESEDEDIGVLFIENVDYGRVLFDVWGSPRQFSVFDEENVPGWRVLTIVPDPMIDEQTGEEVYLPGGVRERYDELHLRLTPSLVEKLKQLGFTEIIYEMEQADLHIPLEALKDEIRLGAPEFAQARGIEAAAGEGAPEAEPAVIRVGAYDFCLEQADALELAEREKELLDEYQLLAPAYRLRLYVIPEGQEAVYSGLDDEGGSPILPVGQRLPDDSYPEGVKLLLLPTEDVTSAPEGAQQIYISYVEQPEDSDVTEILPAEFSNVDGMIYAEIPLSSDGFHAVAAPEGWTAEDGDFEEESFEEDEWEDAEDEDFEDAEDEDFEEFEDVEDENLEEAGDEDFGDGEF